MINKGMPSAVRSNQRQMVDGHGASSHDANDSTFGYEKQAVRANNGKVVGAVRKGVFHKRVRRSRHLLRQPEGWASDIAVLDRLDTLGVELMVLTDVESGNRYRATVGDFRRHGIRLDRGYGPQLVLPLDFWNTTQPGRPEAFQLPLNGVRR